MGRLLNGGDPTLHLDPERTQALSVSMSELRLDFEAIQQLLIQTKSIVDRLAVSHEERRADIADVISETAALLKSIDVKLAALGSKATEER